MPKFKLNKLVRDKLKDEYDRIGQKATIKTLTEQDHKTFLVRKIIEEASEIELDKPIEDIKNELADLQQVIDDLTEKCGITKDQIIFTQKLRYNLKGGFLGGVFVDTLELKDDDPWVEYYRQRPNLFPEEK